MFVNRLILFSCKSIIAISKLSFFLSSLISNFMTYFLPKIALHGRLIISAALSSSNLQLSPISLLVCRRSFSKTADNSSSTVSCEFSRENVAVRDHFKTPIQADPVIAFLKDRDFSETQIFTIIRKFPKVLMCNPGKTLLPKFDFLYSKGILTHEIAEVVSSRPHILTRSLEKHIIPSFNLLTSLFKCEKETVAAIKRDAGILDVHIKSYMMNIEILKENGVPESNVVTLLRRNPRIFSACAKRFREVVEEVKGMGFDPLRLKFVVALIVFRSMSRTTWEQKVDCYKKCGWSDEDIILAFGKNPICMKLSEKKITDEMNYFTTVIGLDPSFICKRPLLLNLSLKKRIIPRGSVAKVLLSRGLIKESCLSYLFCYREEMFLEKFVKPYEEEVPELLNLYIDKLGILEKPRNPGVKSEISRI